MTSYLLIMICFEFNINIHDLYGCVHFNIFLALLYMGREGALVYNEKFRLESAEQFWKIFLLLLKKL